MSVVWVNTMTGTYWERRVGRPCIRESASDASIQAQSHSGDTMPDREERAHGLALQQGVDLVPTGRVKYVHMHPELPYPLDPFVLLRFQPVAGAAGPRTGVPVTTGAG
jgi:hypothetical protein